MHKKDNLDKIPHSIKVLTFFLNDDLFALPVSDLREVNRFTTCRPIEKAPCWVLGMINFHGKATPVFNLKRLLSVEPSQLNSTAMWLAVVNNGSYLCLTVDKVCKFLNMDNHIIDEMPVLADSHDVEHVKYYARVNDNLIPVLDVRGIFTLSEKADGLDLRLLTTNVEDTRSVEPITNS